MKILVVSGFLGAGKTTFIKELISRTGRQIAVLENEYGDTNLDSQDIQETGELKVWEFMEGCVCCSKKDSFANTIIAISASLDPEYLVVEPTGVGKLSNIITNIHKVSYEKIQLLDSLVIVAPISYYVNMREHGELYRDQVASARSVIFSKIENELPELIERVSEDIREINPNAVISDVPYKEHDDAWWNALLESDTEETGTDIDKSRESLDNNPTKLEQVSFRDVHLANVSELIILLEDIIRMQLGGISRAKGVIEAGDDYVRFDMADRLYAITGADTSIDNQAVFIGDAPDMSELEKRMSKVAINDKLRDISSLRRKI